MNTENVNIGNYFDRFYCTWLKDNEPVHEKLFSCLFGGKIQTKLEILGKSWSAIYKSQLSADLHCQEIILAESEEEVRIRWDSNSPNPLINCQRFKYLSSCLVLQWSAIFYTPKQALTIFRKIQIQIQIQCNLSRFCNKISDEFW